MADATEKNDSYWPLYRISEPHPSNDVLLPNKNRLADWLEANGNLTTTTTTASACNWKSTSLISIYSMDSPTIHGNAIFLQGLKARQSDFMQKTRLEQPLVTIDLLRQWRNQVPPGRFLVAEPNTRPPLYHDIGDAKARSFISKVLKHLAKKEKGEMEGGEEEKEESATKKAVSNNSIAIAMEPTNLPRIKEYVEPALSPPIKSQSQVLLGREREMKELHSIYDNVWKRRLQMMSADGTTSPTAQVDKDYYQADIVLVSGPLGVGKSSLVKSLSQIHKPSQHINALYSTKDDEVLETPLLLHAIRNYPSVLEYCSPKDELLANIIKDFCRQVLEGGKKSHLLERYRHGILQNLEEYDIEELTTLVPALSLVLYGEGGSESGYGSVVNDDDNFIDTRTTSVTSTTSANKQEQHIAFFATQRPLLVFQRFLRALTTVSSLPLIVFTQDIFGSWDGYFFFMKSIARLCGSAVVFASTFTSDVTESKCVVNFEFSEKMLKYHRSLNVHHMVLEKLAEEDAAALVAQTLNGIGSDDKQKLSSWIFARAKGHPNFTLELIQYLQRKKLLNFDPVLKRWTYDIDEMSGVVQVAGGPTELYQAIVREAHPHAQENLKIATYLSNPFIRVDMLTLLSGRNDVEMHLATAHKAGLVVTDESGRHAFTSNGVRNAIYGLIPTDGREAFHLKIAQKLWANVDKYKDDSEFLATVLKQFMMSDSSVTMEEDRRSVAALCLQVGQAAAKSIGFVTAWTCITYGLDILDSQKKWGAKNYDLTLQLYNLAIELCYCNTRHDKLEGLINEVLNHARTFDDSLVAKGVQIYALGSRNKQIEAIHIALGALDNLGERFPRNDPSSLRLTWEFFRIKRMLRGMSDADILKLPRMKDTRKVAAMNIMNHVVLYMVYTKPPLSFLLSLRMVKLTIKHGLCAISAVAFVMFAGAISSSESFLEEGFRYGRLALKVYDKFKTEVWLCRVSAGFYGTLYTRKYPFRDSVEPLRHAHRVGLRTGDLEFAMLNACISVWNTAEQVPLPELDRRIRELASETQHHGQELTLALLKPLWQFVHNVQGRAANDPKELKGDIIDEDMLSGKDPHFLLWTRFYIMQLAYLFSDFDRAEKYSDTCCVLYDNTSGSLDIAYVLFYECLVLLAQARRGKRKRRHMAYVRRRVNFLRRWSVHSPSNFLGRQMLLEAELAALGGRHAKALTFYRSSVLHLKEAGFLLPSAIAYELLGKYLLASNDTENAGPCLRTAHDVYKKWGGIAKVEHFEKEQGEYLVLGSPSLP